MIPFQLVKKLKCSWRPHFQIYIKGCCDLTFMSMAQLEVNLIKISFVM